MAPGQTGPNAACASPSQLLFNVLRRPFESSQYACADYVSRLERAGIQPSMSRVGCPWDNAMAERFMRTLKAEEVDGRCYRDLAEAEGSIGRFIEEVYNRQPLHSALNYLAPATFEATLPPPRRLALAPAATPAAKTATATTCV